MKNKSMKIGLSAAASWAWGTSLIMGQQISQEKGIIAWIIWALCNTLSLALFGFLFNKGVIKPEIYRKKGMKIIALIIQMFCLLVQLNFINQQFYILTGNNILSYLITLLIGAIFIMIVYKKGLPTSVKTDVWQWIGAIISICVIIIIGILTNAERQVFASTTFSNCLWGLWSGLILFSGPIGDIQHWQRAEADESKKAYYKSAVAFGMYMLLILGMSFFKFTNLMNILLLIPVLCVTTSTIDSIGVALHELGNKNKGTIFALAMCCGWGLLAKMGMIDMWSSFGTVRYAFALSIILLPLCYEGKKKTAIPLLIVSYLSMILFIVTGQIMISNALGMFSFAIATIIFTYMVKVLIRGE